MKMERSRRPALKTTSGFCLIRGSASTRRSALKEKGGMAPMTQPVRASALSRAGGAEVRAQGVEVQAAITGHVGEAIAAVLFAVADLHHDGLDCLVWAVAADLGDELGAAFGLMLDEAIGGALAIEQGAQTRVDVAGLAVHRSLSRLRLATV
jgi:hypothetical protein